MNRRQFLCSTAAAGLSTALSAEPGGQVDYSTTGAEVIPGHATGDGYAFPAEWVPHEKTLMKFPRAESWSRRELQPARREWANVANTVAEFEPVVMAVQPQDRSTAAAMLSSQIELIDMPLNDAWSRDSGPMIVQHPSGDRRVAGFTFNGWGGKFPPHGDDQLAKGRFAAHLDMPMYQSSLVLEGGAVAFDGEGTILTTEECLLHENRNPDWTRDQVEQELKDHLGATKVIWLPRGLTPDPITDGHVDGIAAFAAPGVVLLHTANSDFDPNTAITAEAKRVLENATDAQGRRFEIIELPLTSPKVVHMNFYICNGGIVVPISGKASEDDGPLAIIRETFPHHNVLGVSGRIIANGGGGVHCITQQVPAI